jgi:hypothetical protein
MPDPIVTEDQILDALHRLRPARWSDVLSFINALDQPAPAVPISTLGDLLESDLVGLWADRTDLGEGHGFARQIRRDASRRAIGEAADAPGH